MRRTLCYEDACGEPELYSLWLVRTCDRQELADRLCDILRAGGYAVGRRFADALTAAPVLELADFIAANSPFETDDLPWLDHCAATYPGSGHPSLTAVERNAARVSWRALP